jgi:hypothetical protein
MLESEGHKRRDNYLFTQLDLFYRWRIGGRIGSPPDLPNVTFAEFSEWATTRATRYQWQILDRVEGIISDLRHNDGVCKAVSEVADELMISSPIPGSSVRQIVERNCGSELLGRMRARF